IGDFHPAKIGDFRPARNGDFRPALTAFCKHGAKGRWCAEYTGFCLKCWLAGTLRTGRQLC
ncbi:hypothetical protein, partial [uncultured Dysosmobacter sp.]|uniref:hypothetical protein n=1 Tax=uncultured Dysosmobacter sp. TaxID=2591384 RepID=UPI002634BAD7